MSKYPVVKFTIIFVLGILFQHFAEDNYYYLIIPMVIFSVTTILVFSTTFSKDINITFSFILAAALIFSMGAFHFKLNNNEEVQYPFEDPKIRNAKIEGVITNIELIKEKKIEIKINLESVNEGHFDDGNSKKFVCKIWKDTTDIVNDIYDELKIGSSITFIGTINKPKSQRNPSEFDYQKYLNSVDISGVINCYKPESVKLIHKNSFDYKNILFFVRKSIDERIKLLHSKKSTALLKGILLADRTDIDYETRNSFVNAGVVHVLAVSGLHVGFISLILILLLGRFDIRVKYLITIFGILLYLMITGAHPSVFRASIMAIVYLVAKLTNRSTNGFNSISLAAIIILLINPEELFNPGFLLSFSAVISILVIYPLLSTMINNLNAGKLIKNFLLFISVSLAAQIGTLPFTLVYFNKLSIIAILANTIIVPLIGVIVAIGIMTLVVSIFFLSLATIIASANIFLIELLYFLVNTFSDFSYSFVNVFNFSFFDGIIFYVYIFTVFLVFKKLKNRLVIWTTMLLLFLSLQSFISLDNKNLFSDNQLSVLAMDVGQGDSFLIKFPNNKVALIDAGNKTDYFDNGERVIYPLLQRLEIDTIHHAFISHLDSDHFAGFISLIDKGIIKSVIIPQNYDSIKDSIFKDFLKFNNIPFSYYCNKSEFIGNCKLYFLSDTSNISYKHFDSNNKSGIIKIVYGKTSFLFVGDAEIEAEELLINKYGEFLKSNVLKVGHHGSNTSSSDNFLDIVNPEFGIISAGIKNKFNHPSNIVLQKLNDRNIQILRTDKEGAILLCSDGESIKNIDWRN